MRKHVLSLLMVIFISIFAISIFFIGRILWQQYKAQSMYDHLAQLTKQTGTGSNETHPKAFYKDQPVLPEYEELYLQNNAMIGWIYVPDTKINYPVMHTPDAPNYYLRRGFDGTYSSAGCPYVQENCDVHTPCDNVIVYGHNMNNETMFGELDQFEKKDFWASHKTLFFNTITQRQEYEIVAVFKTSVSSNAPDAFAYYDFVWADNEQEYTDFVNRCKQLSLYDTGVDAKYGDKLLTLSTCEYSQENGRFVLVAKRLLE